MRTCKFCKSKMPHLVFADYCEWKLPEKARDYAKSCNCGSVKFNLLLSGEIECAKCNEILKGRKWFRENA